MSTMTLEINDELLKDIKKYASLNKQNINRFIIDALIEKVEDLEDIELAEKGLKDINNNKTYSFDEIVKELGI